MWLCSCKTLYTKAGSALDLACGLQFANLNVVHLPLNIFTSLFPKLCPLRCINGSTEKQTNKQKGCSTVQQIWGLLYINTVFHCWKFTVLMNTNGKRLKVDQFSSFLLQAAQASAFLLPNQDIPVRSVGICCIYFLQDNPILL